MVDPVLLCGPWLGAMLVLWVHGVEGAPVKSSTTDGTFKAINRNSCATFRDLCSAAGGLLRLKITSHGPLEHQCLCQPDGRVCLGCTGNPHSELGTLLVTPSAPKQSPSSNNSLTAGHQPTPSLASSSSSLIVAESSIPVSVSSIIDPNNRTQSPLTNSSQTTIPFLDLSNPTQSPPTNNSQTTIPSLDPSNPTQSSPTNNLQTVPSIDPSNPTQSPTANNSQTTIPFLDPTNPTQSPPTNNSQSEIPLLSSEPGAQPDLLTRNITTASSERVSFSSRDKWASNPAPSNQDNHSINIRPTDATMEFPTLFKPKLDESLPQPDPGVNSPLTMVVHRVFLPRERFETARNGHF